LAEDHRLKHPFHMYEAIQAQPDAFGAVASGNEAAAAQFAAAASAGCERLFVCGIGTSYHAALSSEHLMRSFGGGMTARAWHSFDFALYGPELTNRDCVIAVSHRGSKIYTAQSLNRAREAGCTTALITGRGAGVEPAVADAVFYTVDQEKSSAHTVSYVGALAVLAVLAEQFGRHRSGASGLPEGFLFKGVAEAMRAALGLEDEVATFARQHAERRRIWLAGGGPGGITAQEIALKIKETSYIAAEGMPVETMLHGPLQCAEDDDLFILIAPESAAQERVGQLAQAVQVIGAPYVVVSDGSANGLWNGSAAIWSVPAVAEPFTVLTCLVPLQLFAYHLALARGTNPDSFRLEDPRFAKARDLVQL
jgi:glucosamine--fructose-6-phosphate aminotransferase (isomerizing)